MAWFRLAVLLVGGLFTLAVVSPAAPPEPNRLELLLSVQTALQQSREHLQRGNYLAAVQTLEAKIEIINGHPECLRTLREAYFGLIRELNQANRGAEAEVYVRRLKLIDPGAALDLAGKAAASPAPLAPAGSAPPAPVPLATAPVQPLPAPAAGVPNPFTQRPGKDAKTTPAALTAAEAGPGQTTAVRGVPQNADPFAEENNTQMQEARGFLARAEREFADRQYAPALKYYDLAYSLAPKLLVPAQDRWAYCKMHGVVAALNQPGNSIPSAVLERDVRQAMSMAPEKLDRFGQELLRKIADREKPGAAALAGQPAVNAPQVEVRHVGRQGNWNLTETTNFRFYHQVSQEVAEKAARDAEATRLAMTRKWFNETPTAWQPKCDVYLHPTGQDYAQATQQSPSVPGHSTIQNEGERIISRRIDLHVDDPNALIGVLPHETTHVVLAGRFGPKPLPRWADEGLAVLSEPTDRIQRHLNTLPKHYQDGLLFKVAHLVKMEDYPDARSVPAFYAQGVSLCDYLVSKRGPLVFTDFLRDGMRSGWDAAVQRHYGMQGCAELEQKWLGEAIRNPIVRSESSRP